ncbi:MAG: hypothetical protein GY838_13330 [bacterium]|nr:hypothetical protein [bacterium]
MDRRKYFDKQLVEPADLNAAVTNTYNAIGNLMSDIGIFGIISGGVVSEQGVPSMSVDMTGAFIGYDQDGERIYRSTADVIDCSVDYLANATVPTVPGEGRWISIHGRFTYTLQDSKVIDGNTEYLTWKESYEWRVVSGTAAATPTHTKPAKPADAILICDIELITGQVSILNANISTARRDDFVLAAATGISVSAGAWTKLDSAVLNVQTALDSADTELLSRDGSGDLDADLTFAAGTDVGTATKPAADMRGTTFVSYKTGIAGAYAMSAAKTVTKKKIPFSLVRHATDWSWGNSGTYGTRLVKGYIFNGAGGNVVAHLPLVGLPNGATLTNCYITWYEDTTNTSSARLWKKDYQGVATAIGAAATKTTANAWDDDQAINPTSPEVIDLETYEYYMEIIGPTAASPMNVVAASMTYTLSDLGVAAS